MSDQPMTNEWGVEELDLGAYLARTGSDGDGLAPDGATLRALHRAHVAAIPFENLDIALGRGISVELEDVQAKLVRAGRGGYCYEHGLLFAAVLDRLGYSVERLLARVGGDQGRPPPRSHMALHVRGSDGEWLADVGFGAGLLEPLPWGDAGPQAQGGWTYQLLPHGERAWRVRERRAQEWAPLYTSTEEPQHPSDIRVANHFTATHPSSPFVRLPVVMRKDDHEHLRLHGRTLTRIRPDQPTNERGLTDTEVAAALGEDFGLQLSHDETAELLDSLPDSA